MFIKKGDDQKIQLVDPDNITPEQKELVEKVAEQEKSLEEQKVNENQPS